MMSDSPPPASSNTTFQILEDLAQLRAHITFTDQFPVFIERHLPFEMNDPSVPLNDRHGEGTERLPELLGVI